MNIIKGDILGTLYDWFFQSILSFLDEPSKATDYNMLSQCEQQGFYYNTNIIVIYLFATKLIKYYE